MCVYSSYIPLHAIKHFQGPQYAVIKLSHWVADFQVFPIPLKLSLIPESIS